MLALIPTTARDTNGAIRPTEHETCVIAERILDGDGSVYAERGTIIAVAFTESACEALERDAEPDPVSLDYAFDLIGEAEESLGLESIAGARTALKLLRAELRDVQLEMRGE